MEIELDSDYLRYVSILENWECLMSDASEVRRTITNRRTRSVKLWALRMPPWKRSSSIFYHNLSLRRGSPQGISPLAVSRSWMIYSLVNVSMIMKLQCLTKLMKLLVHETMVGVKKEEAGSNLIAVKKRDMKKVVQEWGGISTENWCKPHNLIFTVTPSCFHTIWSVAVPWKKNEGELQGRQLRRNILAHPFISALVLQYMWNSLSPRECPVYVRRKLTAEPCRKSRFCVWSRKVSWCSHFVVFLLTIRT